MNRLLALVVAAALAAGCDSAWNRANREALRRDVEGLFGRYGVPVTDPLCKMVKMTRTGACLLGAPADRLSRLVGGLALREAGVDDPARRAWEGEGGCGGVAPAATRVYRSERRPELHVPSGSALEYLLLYHDERSGRVCVQVSYAYG